MSLRLNRPKNANGEARYHQGIYEVKNNEKYIGDPTDVKFRSNWEFKFCAYCDMNPNILKWGSEVAVIPYMGPDNKQHRYHIDYYIEVPQESGINRKILIEVKPSNETRMPNKPNKTTAKAMESYEYSLKMYQ